MDPDAIVVLLPGECYKMQILGAEEPRIRIVLSREIDPKLGRCIVELSRGSPKTKIQVSTDGLLSTNKHSVAVSIEARATPTLLSLCSCTGDLPAVCSICYRFPIETAERFFQACRDRADAGHKIPVTILNFREKSLCVFEAEAVGGFSWKERMQASRSSNCGFANIN